MTIEDMDVEDMSAEELREEILNPRSERDMTNADKRAQFLSQLSQEGWLKYRGHKKEQKSS